VILALGGVATWLVVHYFGEPKLVTTTPIPEEDWKRLQAGGGGCSILMPIVVRDGAHPRGELIPGRGVLYWVRRLREHIEFALICGEPREHRDEDDITTLLAPEQANAIRSFPDAKVVREERFTWEGFPAREIEVHGEGGRVCILRGLLVSRDKHKRAYQLRVAGVGIRADAGDAAKFFGSFQLEEDKPADIVPPPKPPMSIEPSTPVAEAEWKVLQPPGSSCRILMPVASGSKEHPRAIPFPGRGMLYTVRRDEERCEFALLCGDPSPKLTEDNLAAFLQPECTMAVRSFPGGRVAREEKTTWDGMPGKEIEVRGPRGEVCFLRGYLAGQGATKRLYELRVSGHTLQADAGDVAKFFGSFHIANGKSADATPAPK
jgi:hypothetical protein